MGRQTWPVTQVFRVQYQRGLFSRFQPEGCESKAETKGQRNKGQDIRVDQ